jgi:hypothetical protein
VFLFELFWAAFVDSGPVGFFELSRGAFADCEPVGFFQRLASECIPEPQRGVDSESFAVSEPVFEPQPITQLF